MTESCRPTGDEEGEEYLKDDLINNVHDNDNDLIDERVGDQEDFQINISSARKQYYNHNIIVNTFQSCVDVHQGEAAGDYISAESRNKIGHRSSRAWGLKESRNGGSELADHVSIELFRKIDIWHKNVVFQFETRKIYSISTCS